MDHQTSKLLEKLYDVPFSGDSWEVVFSDIRDTFNAEHAYFYTHGVDRAETSFSPLVFTCGEERTRIYGEYYHHINPFRKALQRNPVGVVYTSSELIGDREYERTEFHTDFLRPSGAYYQMGSYVSRMGAQALAVNLHRTKSQGEFTEGDKRNLSVLQSHLDRAVQLQSIVGGSKAQESAFMARLDSMDCGALLVDRNGKMIAMNAKAEESLAECGGRIASGGVISLPYMGQNERILSMLRQCDNMRERRGECSLGSVTLENFTRQGASVIDVFPADVGSAYGAAMSVALITIRRVERRTELDIRAMWVRHELTPAECRIADALISGERPAIIAEALEITMGTLKFHRKNIFGKVGVSGQVELMKVRIDKADVE